MHDFEQIRNLWAFEQGYVRIGFVHDWEIWSSDQVCY